jgi:preprotein translocase subunit SecE
MISAADKIKLVIAFLFMGLGVAGFYFLGDKALVVRVLAVLGGVAIAAGVAWTSEPGKQFVEFSRESVAETKKVVWPTRKETLQTTGVVFLLVVVMAIFLWLVDALLTWGVKGLMGWGS